MNGNKASDFNPKVTIVIPVYNGANYMRESIDSALKQDYKNIEVLVVNDGSNDNGITDRIARSYGNLISYYKKENGGVASALNYGIEKMQGDYFSWLSHDDMYTEEKISKQINSLSKLEDKTTIINCGYEVVDENGKHMYDVDGFSKYTKKQLETPLFSLFMGFVHGCSLLIHKSHFERVGVFNINLPTTQDYDLWYRMMRNQKMEYIEGLFVKSRCHGGQDSKKLIREHMEECSDLWIRMIGQLATEEMEQIWGSRLKFLLEIRNLLKYERGYKRAEDYVEMLVLTELKLMAQKKKSKDILGQLSIQTGLGIGLINQLIQNRKDKKTKVGFVLGNAGEYGGLNRVVLTMAGVLCDYYDVYLVCVEDTQENVGYGIDSRVNTIKIPNKYLNAIHLAKILYLLSIDVYIESYNCLIEFLKLLKETKIYGIKSIAWNHEFYFIPYNTPDFFNCLEERNRYLQEADAVVWLNSFSAKVYGFNCDNGIVMPNPLTVEASEVCSSGKNMNILAMGRLSDPRKGLKDLLEIFALVLKKCPEAELYILGDTNLELIVPGYDYTYTYLVRRLGICSDRIHLVSWTKNVEPYIINSRVHVMPSVREGFGLVITECAEYGVPSIVYSGSGLEDIIVDGINGFVCPQHDISLMADRIIQLMEDDQVWNKMSLEARKRNDRYSLYTITSKWVNLINLIINNNNGEENKLKKLNIEDKMEVNEEFVSYCIKEYESSVGLLAQNYKSTSIVTEDVWHSKYVQVTNSLSWKITAPLRKILWSIKCIKNKKKR